MRRSGHRSEAGTTTLEHVGLAGAVTVLLAAASAGLVTQAPQVADAIGTRLHGAVAGRPTAATVATGARHAERTRTFGGGSVPVAPPSSIDVRPILGPRGAWVGRVDGRATVAGASLTGRGQACFLCTALAWQREARSGATAS
ncbi:MAG: hypothetical protein JWM86_2539, partial [Thermoleophilia bacterium]|nr:hypothetical protein [Thermoleophilia bacterium]